MISADGQGNCLIDGKSVPAIGFGTYRLQGEVCEKALASAAEAGYHIIDTATYYKNFQSIANFFRKKQRQKFYLISKVWPDHHTQALLHKDFYNTLKQLETEYLDGYLLHWPNNKIPIEETLGAMKELQDKGLIRHLGLSNVTINHLKRALETGISINWVQVEMHTAFYDSALLKFCGERMLVVQAWAPLNRGQFSHELENLSKKYQKTAAQIALRWIVQHGVIPLPASKNEGHIKENLAIQDFALSQEEVAQIDHKAEHGQRKRIPISHGFSFTDEFDFSYEEVWPYGK